MIKKLKNHFIRWNVWRKRSLNGRFYKFLVLIGIVDSPTFYWTLTPEEEAESNRIFWEAVERAEKGEEQCSC